DVEVVADVGGRAVGRQRLDLHLLENVGSGTARRRARDRRVDVRSRRPRQSLRSQGEGGVLALRTAGRRAGARLRAGPDAERQDEREQSDSCRAAEVLPTHGASLSTTDRKAPSNAALKNGSTRF